MKKINLKADCEDNLRLDVFVASKTNYSRSFCKKICDKEGITVNGKISKSNKIIKTGDYVEMLVPDTVECDLTPENIPLNIIYQDADIAVINKPQGLTVHSGGGTNGNTLVNALLYHLDSLSGINGVIRPGIVHRIDKNTSGLLVVAKNDNAHLKLSEQLKDKTCRRIYVALLEGVLKKDSGIIETCISRSEKDRKKMSVSGHGRNAVTYYKVLKRYKNYTLCEFSLKTGRTHQIRVHCQYLGHPIVGDKEYGYKNQKFKLNGQLLHAKTLEFIHPVTNEKMSFRCPIPDYFENVLKKIQ